MRSSRRCAWRWLRPNPRHHDSVQNQLTMSFAGPPTSPRSTRSTATRSSRRRGSRSWLATEWAYLAGIVAVLLGATLVFLKFPHHDEERRLLA
jgi:hypothetical protein